METVPEPLRDLQGMSQQDMMIVLMKNPELQEQVFNLVNIYNTLSGQGKDKDISKYNNNITVETSPISEEVMKSEADHVKINEQTQVVMSPYILPVDRPTYTMNTIADKKPPVSANLPVAVPAEHMSRNSLKRSLDEKTTVPVITVTEESTITNYTVPMETVVSNNNMTLSPDEMRLCKKVKVCHDVEPKNTICSDQMQLPPDADPQFYTFIDRMNSPEYVFEECFENSVAPSSNLSSDLMSSPEYTTSPKALSIMTTSSDEWNENGIASPEHSICQDSDLESDAMENWSSLQNLQNIMNEFAVSPASSVSTFYDIDSCHENMENTNSENFGLSVDDDASIVSALSPSTLSCIDLTEDSEVDDEISDDVLSGVNAISLDVLNTVIQEEKPSVSIHEFQNNTPIIINDSHLLVTKDNTCPTSLPNLSAHTDCLLERISYHQSDIGKQVEYCGTKREKVDATSTFVLTDNTCSIPLPNLSAQRDYLLEGVCQQSELRKQADIDVNVAKRQKLDTTVTSIPDVISLNQTSISDVISLNQTSIPDVISLNQTSIPDVISLNQPKQSLHTDYNNFNECTYTSLVQQDDFNKFIEVHPVFKRDVDGDLPLHISVAKEDVQSTYLISTLMNGRRLDAQNKKEQTALHLACYTENIPIITNLLLYGADPAVVDADGNNMMHIGCLKGSTKILDLLLKYYMEYPVKVMAMLESFNYEGFTPLLIASLTKDMDIIDRLLKLNCNIDVKDMKTGTASLVHALKNCDWELAKYLIENGANVNIPTNAGMYPLDFVGISDNLELAHDLISRNAESGVKTEFTNDKMKHLFESELRKRRRKRNRDARKD